MIGVSAASRAVIAGALAVLLWTGAAGATESTELVDIDAIFEPVEPCHDDSPGCFQRRIFGYFTIFVLAFGGSVVTGGVVGTWIAMVGLRRNQHVGRVPRARRPPVVIAGPVHEDGTWARMVEEDGQRRMEVLGPDGWKSAGRDPSRMMMAMRLAGSGRS
ncbi:MAG: hypothetical protein KIT14_19665 [bacterium]|nr:hypothetical protein [bacterium]